MVINKRPFNANIWVIPNQGAFPLWGVKITDFVILVDREQGGSKKLEEKGYKMHSVIGINELLDILKEEGKIDEDKYKKSKDFIAETQM